MGTIRLDSAIAHRPADGYDGALIDLTGREPTGRAEGTTAMTPEIYTIIAVGIALAGLILNGQRTVTELRMDLNAVAERVNRDIAALGERVARLEGFMEGIRDAIAGKAA